jgi:hypothetical protein
MTGEVDQALSYLEQAAESGCLNLAWLAQDAGLKQLRDEPRFIELVQRFKSKCSCGCNNPTCL